MTWEGESYQARFDENAAKGQNVHGEAQFVLGYTPRSVLDAGCGTGRVAIELARHGVDVVGVDNDPSMLDAARKRGPAVTWIAADMVTVELGRTFDLVVMAGNVPLYTSPGTNRALVANCARHLAAGGSLVCGFQLDRGYELDDYDNDCAGAHLALAERFSTWDRQPFGGPEGYAVSVHRRANVVAT